MKTFRQQLIAIQRRIYRKNVRRMQDNLGHNSAIKRYEKEYSNYLKNYEEISNKAELIKKVLASDLVFHGDYHTLRQSQRSILRVLREIKGKRDIILCLEMFHGSDQKYIDMFMAGKMSESSFLKKIDYSKKWSFSWSNWSPLISFCCRERIPVLGINTNCEDDSDLRSLRCRDQYSARIIAKAVIRNPEKLVYVVDGDYHVSPNHLPNNVEQLLCQLDESVRSLIICQNEENLYWKLCKQGQEEADVLKISENIYCLMNTLPANKIQSYLNWLDYSEDAYFPAHKDWEDDFVEDSGMMVQDMTAAIASPLNLELPTDALERLLIYYASDLYFIDMIYDIPELKGKIRLIKERIRRDEGFLIEYERDGEESYLIYLANSSINMAAEEACHFLNAALRGRLKIALSPFDRFYRNIMIECLGFFGSKFINEKRKSNTENAIRRFLGNAKHDKPSFEDAENIKVARLLLQHFYLQRKGADVQEFMKKFYPQYKSQSAVSRIFSTQLGYMLGNRLYYAVKSGKFSVSKVREIFRDPFDESEKAFECYLEIYNQIKKVNPVMRM